MTTETRIEFVPQPYDPSRRWKQSSPPATGGSTRVVFHCVEIDEYAEVSGSWHNGGFRLFGNAHGRGIEYYTLTGPTGVEHRYERLNGKTYAPAEFQH